MVSMSIMSKSNTVGNEFGKFRTLCILLLTSIFLQENALTSAFSPFPSIARLPHRPAPRFFNNSTKIVMDRLSTVMKTQSLDDDEEEPINRGLKTNPIINAMKRFKEKPITYLIIPCVAAVVGWVTNWLAVQMIFYPVSYRGLSLYRREEIPLGLFGWQGIVPCKTRPMSDTMVNMVTTQLLSVKEVFRRLDPRKVAELLAPEVSELGQTVLDGVLPFKWLANIPSVFFRGLPTKTKDLITFLNYRFLKDFTVVMQDNIESLFSVRNCVVKQMMVDRSKLGELFRRCGSKELDFLTNSGLWFGFLLGVIQMTIALFWDNPWTMSIGGGIVGYATNWLALKWIFEPVNPTKFGPFILQGQFLRRQKEVSDAFSEFFANNILTSEKMWNTILTDPETTPAFRKLFTESLEKFTTSLTSGLGIKPKPEVFTLATSKAFEQLPKHIGVLHPYVDDKLKLQETLRASMEKMSSAQFERVLHPIFEEDELTLILAGAALGFAAGLIQQGLATGKLKVPSKEELWKSTCTMSARVASFSPKQMILKGVGYASAKIGYSKNKKLEDNDISD